MCTYTDSTRFNDVRNLPIVQDVTYQDPMPVWDQLVPSVYINSLVL